MHHYALAREHPCSHEPVAAPPAGGSAFLSTKRRRTRATGRFGVGLVVLVVLAMARLVQKKNMSNCVTMRGQCQNDFDWLGHTSNAWIEFDSMIRLVTRVIRYVGCTEPSSNQVTTTRATLNKSRPTTHREPLIEPPLLCDKTAVFSTFQPSHRKRADTNRELHRLSFVWLVGVRTYVAVRGSRGTLHTWVPPPEHTNRNDTRGLACARNVSWLCV
jgi:hypothetical protein